MKFNAEPETISEKFHIVCAADVVVKEQQFIWSERIPAENVTLLYGEPGIGKTILCCKIAADVSSGHVSVPNVQNQIVNSEPAKVIYIAAEESAERIAYYIQKNGGDLNNVAIVNIDELTTHAFLENDFNTLCAMIALIKPQLIVMDPWIAFINATTSKSIKWGRMREIYHDLMILCHRTNCSTLLTMYPTKLRKVSSDGWQWTQATEELYNGCRSVLQVVRDIDGSNNKVLVHTKANLSRCCDSVKFSIQDSCIDWQGESEINRQVISYAGSWNCSIAEVVAHFRNQRNVAKGKEEAEP